MYIHSVKVSPVYKTAAKIVEQVKENGGSLKDLVYQQKRRIHAALLALVLKTLQHGSDLDYLIRTSNILHKEPRLSGWLTRVLITELLWGKKTLGGESKPVKTILSYQSELTSLLSQIEPVEKPKLEVKKPRYVRVNTLVMTTNDAIDGFRDEGWIFVRHSTASYQEFLNIVSDLAEDQFTVDFHITDLLIFPPKTQFYNHQCYLDGSIILQDKASCIPTFLLSPTPGSVVIDMCAAPGMKTSHLAAIMKNEGTIHAIEKDQRRCQTLSELVQLTKATCVKVINRDSLTMTATELPNVEYVLIDPSCSGSGMTDRLSAIDSEEKCAPERLENLAAFQITILRSAFKHFPNAKRIVYSTCSIYPQENEQVVKRVLETTNSFKLVDIKSLLKKEWFNFGSNEYENVGPKCLYAKSDIDLTNGFFVAVFEKLTEEEKANNALSSGTQIKKKKFKKNKYQQEDSNINGEELGEDASKGNNENEEIETIENESTKHQKKKKKRDAIELAEVELDECVKSKKKSKKREEENYEINSENLEENENQTNDNSRSHKKKKKKSKDAEVECNEKLKKRKRIEDNGLDQHVIDEDINIPESQTKRKKKSKHNEENEEGVENILSPSETLDENVKPKKKKKLKEVSDEYNTVISEETKSESKKKKKSKHDIDESNDHEATIKKKKKKSKD